MMLGIIWQYNMQTTATINTYIMYEHKDYPQSAIHSCKLILKRHVNKEVANFEPKMKTKPLETITTNSVSSCNQKIN